MRSMPYLGVHVSRAIAVSVSSLYQVRSDSNHLHRVHDRFAVRSP